MSRPRVEERPDSDIDLLVQFSETKSLLEIVRIEREFSEHFGRPVDLVTEGELSPYIRDEILQHASAVYGAPRGESGCAVARHRWHARPTHP